jgi:hypothetical protein
MNEFYLRVHAVCVYTVARACMNAQIHLLHRYICCRSMLLRNHGDWGKDEF